MLKFLSFCVTWHLHDGRESCHVGKKWRISGNFFYLSLERVLLWCLWVPRGINSRFCTKTRWQMFLLRPPFWCPSRWAPSWRLHTNLYKFGKNFSSRISYTEYSSDLNLSDGLCMFTSFHFPDSGFYLLNGFDFYFDIFWMAWHWKPAIDVIVNAAKKKKQLCMPIKGKRAWYKAQMSGDNRPIFG